MGKFLSDILQEVTKIRERLAVPKLVVMKQEAWENFNNANECHICNESLMKG